MRTNSQSLLLILYYPDPMSPVFIPERALANCLPDITISGLRSLLHSLAKQSLVSKRSMSKLTYYTLTSTGRTCCERLFPALRPLASNMQVLIFLRSPMTDKGFHYLRRQCVKRKAIALTKGVYLFPTGLPVDLSHEIKKFYENMVALLRVTAIESGFDWNTISESLELWDVIDVYSGISKEAAQLLIKNQSENGLNNSDKKHIADLISRFLINLRADSGLNQSSIPERDKPLSLLSRLQELIIL